MKDFGKTAPVSDLMLARLIDGNKRFAADKLTHPNQGFRRGARPGEGQQPFAVILTCSDALVPPEVLFDVGLGDLFVVRVAGQVLSEAVLASVEFAVTNLHVPIVVVLGHSQCTAVAAAVRGQDTPAHFAQLASALRPAVERGKRLPGDPVENGGRAQAQLVADHLRFSRPVLQSAFDSKRLKIVAAYFNLSSGLVELLD